jgi:hypothetical protein
LLRTDCMPEPGRFSVATVTVPDSLRFQRKVRMTALFF